jgi:hypothetical protein
MSYPPGPYEGPPAWWGQPQPSWQGQPPPGYPAPQPGWPAQREPDNYLVWAILVTIMCCLPLGIVSIVYSAKVSGLWVQGRYAEAQTAADNAKKWAIIGAIAGPVIAVVVAIVYFILIVVAFSIPSTTITPHSSY